MNIFMADKKDLQIHLLSFNLLKINFECNINSKENMSINFLIIFLCHRTIIFLLVFFFLLKFCCLKRVKKESGVLIIPYCPSLSTTVFLMACLRFFAPPSVTKFLQDTKGLLKFNNRGPKYQSYGESTELGRGHKDKSACNLMGD